MDPSSAQPKKAAESTAAQPADTLGPRYAAAIEDGINLTRDGLPNFVATMSGLSKHEPWGRWTDGDVVVLKFAAPLPQMVIVELSGGAYGGNIGKPVRLKVGAGEGEVTFKGGPFESVSTVQTQLANPGDSDTLVILVPDARVASATDGRRLGLALSSIRVMPAP